MSNSAQCFLPKYCWLYIYQKCMRWVPTQRYIIDCHCYPAILSACTTEQVVVPPTKVLVFTYICQEAKKDTRTMVYYCLLYIPDSILPTTTGVDFKGLLLYWHQAQCLFTQLCCFCIRPPSHQSE